MMNDAAKPTRAQRQQDRREEILRAATEVFFDAGFAGASIDDVLAKVGGSKRTIYTYFGNKEALFAAIVTEISAEVMGPLGESEVHHRDLETTLYEVGLHYLNVVMSPVALRLYRAIVAEGARFPELAKIFFESGPGRASARLACVLDDKRGPWGIRVDDAERAAEQFFGMIRDDLHLKVVLGMREPPDGAESRATVRQAAAVFAKGSTR